MLPALAAVQGVLGAVQLAKGLGGEKEARPRMDTPASVKRATANAEMLANAGARPGNDQALNAIRQTSANSIGAAKDSSSNASDVLAAVSRANQAEQGAIQQNNAANDQFAFSAKQNLQNQLNQQGQFEQQSFMANKMQPYLQSQQSKADLTSAGVQNINNAASDFGSIHVMKNPQKFQSYFKMLSGNV